MSQEVRIQMNALRLTSYQSEILYSDARFTVTEAGTKTGKTFSHIWWLFEQAHTYKAKEGRNYWWVAPVHGQAQIAFKRMWKKVAKTGLYERNKSEQTITTPLGTIIHFKSAKDPDNLYGEDVYSAVFDEFTRSTREAWFALRSTLTATKAPCKFVGNYIGNSNWGHILGQDKMSDDQWDTFIVDALQAVDAGIIDQEEFDQARKDLPKWMFDALYLCKGDIDQARMIDADAIDDLRYNHHVDDPEAPTKLKKYITADIAMQGSDKFVIGVWYGWRLIDVIVRDKVDGKQIVELIEEVAKEHGVPKSRIAYDGDGLGAFIGGYLDKAKAFINGSKAIEVKKNKLEFYNLKSQCYYILAEKINEAGMTISADVDRWWPEIAEDLECVKNRNFGTDLKFRVLKKEEVKKLIGRSPDFSDMMMMRAIFDLDKKYTGKYSFI